MSTEAKELEHEEGAAEDKPKEGSGQLELFLEANRKNGEDLNERFDRLTQELRRQNEQPREAKPETPQPIYTAAQLQPLIESGDINAAQAAEYLAEAKVAKLEEKLRREMDQKLETQSRQASVQSKLTVYQDAIPELADRTSDEFKRLNREYQMLVTEDGKPRGEETLLEACRLTFGRDPAKAKPRETTAERQRSVERSGSGGGRTADRSPEKGKWPEWVPKDNRDWWERQIQRKVYTGMDDPKLKKELAILQRKVQAA